MSFACQRGSELLRPRGPDFLQLSLQHAPPQLSTGISAHETTGGRTGLNYRKKGNNGSLNRGKSRVERGGCICNDKYLTYPKPLYELFFLVENIYLMSKEIEVSMSMNIHI